LDPFLNSGRALSKSAPGDGHRPTQVNPAVVPLQRNYPAHDPIRPDEFVFPSRVTAQDEDWGAPSKG